MHTFWKLPLVLLLVLLAPPAWGGDESVSDYVAQRWAGLFSDQGPQADSKQATAPLYQTSLTPTFFAPPPGLAPTARPRTGDRSTPRARPPVYDHMAERNLRH